MKRFQVEGIPQSDLDLCVGKVEDLVNWTKSENLDSWALRASLLKALYENADEYFARTKGNYRQIAAFDNGVARSLEELKGDDDDDDEDKQNFSTTSSTDTSDKV